VLAFTLLLKVAVIDVFVTIGELVDGEMLVMLKPVVELPPELQAAKVPSANKVMMIFFMIIS